MGYVPLHVHSQYSILRSTASIEALAQRAAKFGCTGLGLTDSGNMFGAVEFYKACKKEGIHPVLGCELYVAPVSRHEKKKVPGHFFGYPLVFLVKEQKGYQNLCKLSSLAHLEGFYYAPRIDKELIEKHKEGLICFTGSLRSLVGTYILQEKEKELEEEIKWLHSLFGDDLYFEVQRHGMDEARLEEGGIYKEPWLLAKVEEMSAGQEKIIERLRGISRDKGIPLVATPDIHYIDKDGWKAQEILINIQSGEPREIWEKDSAGNLKARKLNPKREVMFSHEYYFKSPEEMGRLFADLPEAISTTQIVSDKCNFDFDFKARYYPVFIPPELEGKAYKEEERVVASEAFLRRLCSEGLFKRYTKEVLAKVSEHYPGEDPMEVVKRRLTYELDIITSKGMGDYLLIVYDFIAWAKKNGIPMGPGRGSGAGSVILYLIGITDIEPLRFQLFFERFINPERISYPDIDVDICMERRQEVIDYTVAKYGKERVAQIITFGTMKAKMALKDVGRVLSVPLAKVNALAKLIPEELNMTLERALELDPDLLMQYTQDAEVKEMIDMAISLEGCVRNTGIHAAGLIIGGGPLMETIPLCYPKDSSMAVTQFSMKPVEAVGLLKIDFLGLKTLSSIQRAVNAVCEKRQKKLDWVNLPLDDAVTFDLLNQGKTQGVFQLESGGMQELAKQLHIDKFEEIIAVGALYRPGPMEMIPSFIQRKHGKEAIEIDHPWMESILKETYGIMVYQEQVMQIASRLAGYSLGEGDVLRRAMGKKDRQEMATQREKFREGALQNGISEQISMLIFDKIEKFASYGFNKSHAAAYGYLSYVTAFLKANYPMEWMAALMTSDRDDVTKVAKMIRESRSAGIAVLPPSINESTKEFVATKEGIRFAMLGIRGVGEGVVEAILAEREKRGLFKSLYDFIKRIDTKKVGKKVIESLIEAGCFDFTGWMRAGLVASVDPMFSSAVKKQKEEALGVMDFFSLIGEEDSEVFAKEPLVTNPPSKEQVLQREYELLGFYLREHPLDSYKHLFPALSCCPLSQAHTLEKIAVFRTACIVESVVIKVSAKSQRKFAIVILGDGIESYEVPIWSDLYEQVSGILVETQLVYAVLQMEQHEGDIKLQCRWLYDLTRVDEEVLASCDEAYDKAKGQMKIAELKEKRGIEKKAPKEKGKEEKKQRETVSVHIKVDINKAALSHILSIKKVFRSRSGASPVKIFFISAGEEIGSVEIGKEWGVEWSEMLSKELESIDSIETVQTIG